MGAGAHLLPRPRATAPSRHPGSDHGLIKGSSHAITQCHLCTHMTGHTGIGLVVQVILVAASIENKVNS